MIIISVLQMFLYVVNQCTLTLVKRLIYELHMLIEVVTTFMDTYTNYFYSYAPELNNIHSRVK